MFFFFFMSFPNGSYWQTNDEPGLMVTLSGSCRLSTSASSKVSAQICSTFRRKRCLKISVFRMPGMSLKFKTPRFSFFFHGSVLAGFELRLPPRLTVRKHERWSKVPERRRQTEEWVEWQLQAPVCEIWLDL